MGEVEAVLERGCFYVYRRGPAFVVLSPEGDTHRLIRLMPEPGGLSGSVVAVAGRPAHVLNLLPAAAGAPAGPLLAGEYRLLRRPPATALALAFDERPGEPSGPWARPEDGAAVFDLSVRHPRACAANGCPVLPPHLARRLIGRAAVPADPPDFLDYRGVQLQLVPQRLRPGLPLAAAAPLRLRAGG